MDEDSSTKFIGSLTKFLQSLCNGYVEFQRGVELVGHIYLSIDTGEKVDYILHEKVNKNDENSVTFVSNSFHAQPVDKKPSSDKDKPSKLSARNTRDSDDDGDDNDIMIVDQSDVPGSTNSGTVFPRGGKYVDSVRGIRQGSMNPMSSLQRNRQPEGRPSATMTSRNTHQENINIGDVKLEQLSADELLSLASQVGEEGSSQSSPMAGQHGGAARDKRSSSLGDAAGQPVWIKQEMPDDLQGGSDTGWSHGGDGQSDSGNSGSDLYPVMMHQNPAFSSTPVFPGFSSISGPSSAAASRHHSQPLPGMSGAAHPYANPMPGTSQGIGLGEMDPAATERTERRIGPKTHSHAEYMRQYRARMKYFNPEKYRQERMKDAIRTRNRRAQLKLETQMKRFFCGVWLTVEDSLGISQERRLQAQRPMTTAEYFRLYRQRMKIENPEKYRVYLMKSRERSRKRLEKRRTNKRVFVD